MELNTRFWNKVDKSGACWIWTAGCDKYGYGRFRFEKRKEPAHRVAWYLEHGEFPKHTIDHICRNKKCVNPSHLEDVTVSENTRRRNAAITHCPQGHEYNEVNTRYYTRVKNGKEISGRQCKICNREACRKSALKRKNRV